MEKLTMLHHDNMYIVERYNRFSQYIKVSDTDKLPTISIVGEAGSTAKMCWSTVDNINHSYFKYRTNKNLSGVELKFSLGLEFDDPSNHMTRYDFKPYMLITDNNGKESYVYFGFLGEVKIASETHIFDKEEVGEPFTIYLDNPYIKRDNPNLAISSNVSISWQLEDRSGICSFDTDFNINYEEGYINFKRNHSVPTGATLFVNYYYHCQEKYHIQFSNLYGNNFGDCNDYWKVDVSDVKDVVFSIGTIHEDYKVSFIDWEVIRGELSYRPSRLKENNIKSGHDFDKIHTHSVTTSLNNLLDLGYSNSVFINIGKEMFCNIDKESGLLDLTNPFSNIFKKWFSDYLYAATNHEIKDISVVIPSDLKYLPNELYQQDELGNISKFINPIHEQCIELIVNMVDILKSLNKTNINLKFLIDDYGWSNNEEMPTVFDDYIKELYALESNNDSYLSEGLYMNDLITSEKDMRVLNWLSDKLVDNIFILRERADIEPITHSSYIFSNTLQGQLNNTFNFIDSIYENSSSVIQLSINFDEFKEYDTELMNKLENLGYSKDRFNIVITNIDDSSGNVQDNWQLVNDWIYQAYYSENVTNITIDSLYSIIRDDYFLYKPAPYVELKNIDTQADIILCRANKTELGYLSTSKITSLDVSITQTDALSIEVPFYILDRFSKKTIINPFYYDVVEERLIKLNNDYFVIKEVNEIDGDTKYKSLSCSSLESKLSKSEVRIEATSLQMHSDDDSDEGVLNLLEKDTGWKAGYIDPSIKFEKIDGVTVAKYRWFESITTDWLNFLNNDVAKAFNCVLQYDTTNMTVNVYNANTLGTNRGLYLSKNNYIKSKEKKGDTNSIATRLRCFGKDEIDISTVSLTGLNYIEDYSYFIELGDVSDELQIALSKYNQIVVEANSLWKETNTKYLQDISLASSLSYEIRSLEAEIEVLENMKKAYLEQEDTDNANKIDILLSEAKQKLKDAQATYDATKLEIEKNTKLLSQLSSQLDKTKTVDENGELVFTPKLLDELNCFVYWDTFTDTAYDSPEKLLEGGLREMALRCKPNSTYEIDSINFLEQLLDVNRKTWKEGVYLGDMLILQDTDSKTEEMLFFVGYTLNFKDNSLKIRISNKKSDISSTVAISNLLTNSKNVKKALESKMYLLNKMKYDKGE